MSGHELSQHARETLIRAQDWRRSAGRDWRDGLLLGNGNLAAVASAPAHLEWVLNKVDVFDATVDEDALKKRLPHAQVMAKVAEQPVRNSLFLNDAERSSGAHPGIRNTISAAVLRLRFWQGIGWAAPATPLTTQHLSFYDGRLDEAMDAHGFHPRMSMFIPRGREVFCLRIEETGAPCRSHVLELVRPTHEELPAPQWRESGQSVGFSQRLPGGRGSYAVALCLQPRKRGQASLGMSHHGTRVELHQQGDVDVFVSVKSSWRNEDPLEAAFRELACSCQAGYEVLESENRLWWQSWWSGGYADFGDHVQVQRNYTFSLYQLACSFGVSPMPGLNGLGYGPLEEWVPGVSYQGYTHDQNAQIPAMAFFPTGRTKLIEVLCDTYWQVRKTLRRETRKLFGCEGICLPLTMNQLGLEYPTRSYRYTLCGSAYTGMILAMAWRFSRDLKLLKEHIYPLLRELVSFHVALMAKGEDGRYHLDWSVPPEIFTFTRDDTATLAMLKQALKTAVEAAKLLRRDRRRAQVWQDVLEHYPELSRTPEGAHWCGPDVPLNHYFFGGHLLYPFFPAAVDLDGQAAGETLKLIERAATERSWADFQGQWHPNHEWSMFLITSTRIRLGDRQAGWRGLERYLELFAKENGLFSHDPILIGKPQDSEDNERRHRRPAVPARCFCDGELMKDDNPEVPHPSCVTPNQNAKRLAPGVLEGNSAFLCMASETLLQSQGGIIRLFPAVPPGFTGAFWELAAEGGFLVSAEMRKGTLNWVRVQATVAGHLRLQLRPDELTEKDLDAQESFVWEGC